MVEVKMRERQQSEVTIANFEDAIILAFVEFLYTGWTEAIDTNSEGLLKIAHQYQDQDLIHTCWDSLRASFDVTDPVKLLLLTDKFDDEIGTYKKMIGRSVLDDFVSLRKTPEFQALVKELSELFADICALNFWGVVYDVMLPVHDYSQSMRLLNFVTIIVSS